MILINPIAIRLWIAILSVLSLLFPAAGSSSVRLHEEDLFPITRAQVQAAIRTAKGGQGAIAEDIIMLAPVRSKGRHPELQVSGIRIDEGRGTAEIRLRCIHHECLPFLVIVKPRLPIAEWKAEVHVISNRGSSTVAPSVGPTVKQGQASVLIRTEPGMRISIPVVALQAGSSGQSIRVRAVVSSRCYRAVVQQDGSLRYGTISEVK